MKNNLKKDKDNLRNIKKNFIKDTDLEPTLKYEISKELNNNKKNNRKYWK
mgnify:CR=1 FL=1